MIVLCLRFYHGSICNSGLEIIIIISWSDIFKLSTFISGEVYKIIYSIIKDAIPIRVSFLRSSFIRDTCPFSERRCLILLIVFCGALKYFSFNKGIHRCIQVTGVKRIHTRYCRKNTATHCTLIGKALIVTINIQLIPIDFSGRYCGTLGILTLTAAFAKINYRIGCSFPFKAVIISVILIRIYRHGFNKTAFKKIVCNVNICVRSVGMGIQLLISGR